MSWSFDVLIAFPAGSNYLLVLFAVYGVKGVNRQAWSASWKLNCFESKKHSWMQSWFFCVLEGQRVINGDCWLFDVLRHLSYSVYGWVADICVRNSQELASPEKNAHLWQRYDSCCSWLQRPTSRSPVWCLLSFNMIVASNVEGSWKLTKDDVILRRERDAFSDWQTVNKYLCVHHRIKSKGEPKQNG